MKNKKSNSEASEKLLDELLCVDEDLLIDAVEVDSEEKLGAYLRKGGHAKKKSLLRPAFRCGFIIAAAAVLAVSMVFGGIMAATGVFTPDETDTISDTSIGDTLPENSPALEIDSLDKLNYYGGKRVIESGNAMSISALTPMELTPTVLRNPTETREEDIDDHVTDDGSMGAKDFVGSADVSGETFRITLAINYFIDIPENDKFLSKKVGPGRVEVMITDLYMGMNGCAMITFRNGDRFFSCLTEMNELQDGENSFFTHLYIDGFYFYKDLREGVSQFEIYYDTEKRSVDSMSWIPYNRIPKDAPVYPITIVEDSVRVSEGDYEFTLWQLNEYFFGNDNTDAEVSNG